MSREQSASRNSKENSVDASDNGGPNNNHEKQEDSSSEEEEESEYDEEVDEQRRSEYLEDIGCLEKYFSDLKEILYRERIVELDQKMKAVEIEMAPEYLEPLHELEENLRQAQEAASLKREQQRQTIRQRYEEEEQTAQVQFEEDCQLLLLQLQVDQKETIRRLMEEKVAAQLASAENWHQTGKKRRTSEFAEPEKKRKPSVVSDPYVVYMLKDIDILEDIAAVRKGRAKFMVQQKSYGSMSTGAGSAALESSIASSAEPKALERNHVIVDQGEICCNGQCFQIGSRVLVERAYNGAYYGTVKDLSAADVTVLRSGESRRISFLDIQDGLYTLKPPLTMFPDMSHNSN